jgi:hypothetical protein
MSCTYGPPDRAWSVKSLKTRQLGLLSPEVLCLLGAVISLVASWFSLGLLSPAPARENPQREINDPILRDTQKYLRRQMKWYSE